jgi:eukaryotic-like serine/threonine-protein kinase
MQPSLMERKPGDVFGPYELVSPIGKGGMGEVWKARDTRLHRDVAIKFCANQFSDRFQREALAIAALNHPNICTLYDVGPDYLVMEHIEGAPPRGPLATSEAVRLTLGIAAALEAAHCKGITHRDLKPANVLVTQSGLKLLDFGLALVNDSAAVDIADAPTALTVAGAVMGTIAYMSPEQAQGKPADARSDIFSFGLMLYEMLSGRQAFAGNSVGETMAAIMRDEAAPLHPPSTVSAVITRCIRKSPADRFQTMSEVRTALEQVIEQAALKPTGNLPSIAVLPFANMSADKENEYFSDGLAEEILNLLARIPGLKVIARTSSFAFRGKEQDITKIAEALRVQHILEGSVRRSGNRIRVTAQLITSADGTHLWSERYDRQMEDLFAVQDEIAAAITSELKVKFARVAGALPRRQPNLQAYEAYLRYRQHQWLFTPEALRRSKECLEQAIALDPEFALPYVGLADHYFTGTHFERGHELVPRARKLALRALELDPDLAEAQGMLGVLSGLCEHHWSESERWFQQAMSRPTVPWHVRLWYSSFYLVPVGRMEDARREAERARQDNPLGQIVYWSLATALEGLGLDEETQAACNKMAELDPQFWFGMWVAGMHEGVCGRTASARMWAERVYSLSPRSQYAAGLMAGVLRLSGEEARAELLLAESSSVARASCHLVCGEFDDAVTWAGRAADDGYALAAFIFMPYKRLLNQSPGWPELLKKLNLD